MKRFFKENWLVIVTGVVVGIAALLLQALGNPKNMGFCIACFERDIAGALGLHGAAVVQYVRPEIIGIVLGSCIMALIGKEFRAQAGSSPATRFAVGALGAVKTAVYLYLTPVITLICSALVLHESMTPASLGGAALTMLGLLLSQWDSLRGKKKIPDEAPEDT